MRAIFFVDSRNNFSVFVQISLNMMQRNLSLSIRLFRLCFCHELHESGPSISRQAYLSTIKKRGYKQLTKKTEMRFQITDACLEYHSKQLDLSLNGIEPSPFDLIHDDSPINPEEDSSQTPELQKEMALSSTGQQESQSLQVESKSSQRPLGKKKPIHRGKNSTIFREEEDEESDESDESESRPPRRRAPQDRRAKKPEGYHTKNFLPPFKGPHLNFLRKELGAEYVESFQVFQEIMAKDGVSMKDYQALYNIPEFHAAFEKFFSENVLYRELLISRSNLKSRLAFVKFIHMFKRAFDSKTFDKIN